MVAALDEARVERLIQKTISKGRSIGTLNFTLRNLLGKNKTLNIGKALEQKIGTKGFWNLVIGAGTPGALVDLLQDFDQEFCEEFLQAGRFQSQKQWEQVLDRGDFFQLCELVSKCDFLFATETGGERLAAAVRAVLNRLVVKSNWYQRRGGVAQLTNLPNSGMRDIVLNALDMWLEEREIDGLSFANLHETVDGIQLMYERRPDIRPELAKHLSTWLSSLKEWRLDPKRDMGLAQNLLGLSAHSEFSNQDAYVVVDAVVQRLTRDVMTKCRTQDLLWSIWKLFATTIERYAITPEVCRSRYLTLFKLVADVVASGATKADGRDELRPYFAILGLLDFLDIHAAPSAVSALGAKLDTVAESGVWWLCADQAFVSSWLILRGHELRRPLLKQGKRFYLATLLSG